MFSLLLQIPLQLFILNPFVFTETIDCVFCLGVTTIPFTRLFVIGVRTAIINVLYGFTAAPETIPTRFKR